MGPRMDRGFDILIALARLYQVFDGNNASRSRGCERAPLFTSVIGALLCPCVLQGQPEPKTEAV
jgi:hypothetical protein